MGSARLKILNITPWPPSPPRSGAQARMHGLNVELARRHELTVVSLIDPSFDAEATSRALREYCQAFELVPDPGGQPGWARRVLQARSLLSRRSFQHLRFRIAGLQPVLDRVLGAKAFDVVRIDLPYLAYYRVRRAPSGSPPPCVVLDTHDISYDLQRQVTRSNVPLGRRVYAALNWRKLAAAALPANAAEKDTRCFEMRTYYAAPGKLDDLLARFRDHTVKLFEKHGITNIGYWVPIENTDNKLVYVIAFPSREEQKKCWREFVTDPDWKAAAKASEENGKLLTKVESVFLNATDFSPAIKPSVGEPRVFELRTYTTTPGNLGRLQARFRDHTVALFTKHGMTNLFYWTPMADQKTAENTLVYLLAHKDADAAKASFGAFRADPIWIAAKEASEKDGGGSLTVPDGVKSEFLKVTDFSPTR